MNRWRTRTIIRDEPALAALPPRQAAVMVDALERRRCWWWPGFAGTMVMWGWVIMMMVATLALDDTIFDIRRIIHWFDPLDDVVGSFVYLVMAGVLGIVTMLEMRRRMLRRAIRTHLVEPRCFWCGYSLRGLRQSSNDHAPTLITCPECGHESAASARSATVPS